MPSFIRNARVTVATRIGSVKTDKTGQRFKTFGDKTVIEGMRVYFKIVKTLKPDSNKATLTIVNLAKETRALFTVKPVHITLETGHNGEYAKLYEGDLIRGPSKQMGTEWLTELQLGTGHDAMGHARVSKSFKIGADPKTVVKELLSTMGQTIPKDVDELKQVFSSGISLNGPSDKELTRILKVEGMSWSNQDGRVQILKGTDATSAPAIVVSQNTGMIGSPELGAPEKAGEPAVLKVKKLLDPELSPGGLISVKSKFIQGTFRVFRVLHSGDTHSQTWYSDIEATPL